LECLRVTLYPSINLPGNTLQVDPNPQAYIAKATDFADALANPTSDSRKWI
jgi:hypothetical protein